MSQINVISVPFCRYLYILSGSLIILVYRDIRNYYDTLSIPHLEYIDGHGDVMA